MANQRIPQTGKHIAFDSETRDFSLFYDGVWIGYAPTESAGQLRLNDHAYQALTHRQLEMVAMNDGGKDVSRGLVA